jgi:hypothetical protein
MKKFMVMLCLIVLCLAVVWAGSHRKSGLAGMNVTVIDVNKNGYFNYYGRVSKKIERGEQVVWISNVPFTVYFGNESPLVMNANAIPTWGSTMRGVQARILDDAMLEKMKRRMAALNALLKHPPENLGKMKAVRLAFLRDGLRVALEKATAGKCFIAIAWVSQNALSGRYKYIIAAFANGNVWVDDPEDIVDPPPR